MAIEGNTAVIGKLTGVPLMSQVEGAAYIFVKNGATWTQQQKLLASDNTPNGAFGESVSISGDKIAVAAHRVTVGSNTTQGAAYIFAKSGAVWSQQQKLTASDGASR